MRNRRAVRAAAAIGAALSLTLGGLAQAAPAAPALSGAAAPTGWSSLNKAIERIPSYRPGAVRWVVTAKFGFWGTADWYENVLYVDPTVPLSRVYDVAVHEWSHELSVLDYGGNVSKAKRAMNRYFGGAHLVGAERAADCMALVQGATWTHYTTCRSLTWRRGARRLVNGRRLPR